MISALDGGHGELHLASDGQVSYKQLKNHKESWLKTDFFEGAEI